MCAAPCIMKKNKPATERENWEREKESVCCRHCSRRFVFSFVGGAASFFKTLSLLSLFSLSLSPKETHNVRQQGPEEAHEDDLDDGQEGLLEKRGRERELKKEEVSANSSEQAN